MNERSEISPQVISSAHASAIACKAGTSTFCLPLSVCLFVCLQSFLIMLTFKSTILMVFLFPFKQDSFPVLIVTDSMLDRNAVARQVVHFSGAWLPASGAWSLSLANGQTHWQRGYAHQKVVKVKVYSLTSGTKCYSPSFAQFTPWSQDLFIHKVLNPPRSIQPCCHHDTGSFSNIQKPSLPYQVPTCTPGLKECTCE